MKTMLRVAVMAAAVAASAALQAEMFTVGDWELTGGGNAALTLSYKGRKLLSDVTLGGWTDGYKRGTFGGRGYAARREGDTVTFSKTGPNANVKLAVTLAKGRAAFAMDVDILKEFGPVEYGFNIPLDSFAEKDGSVWPMVGRTFCPIEPGRTFESVGGRRLAFEYPDAQYAFTVLEGNAFALQDRRRQEGGNHVRFIACRRSTGPCRMSWKHEWTVNESFDAETRARRRIAFGHPRQRLVPIEFSNPGFEDGAAGWSLPPKAAYDAKVAHGGKGSVRLRVDDPKKDSCYVTRQVPVKPGARYRASCFVKTEDVRDTEGRMPSVGAGLIVEWADKDGKWCGSGEYACGIFGTKDWQKVECRNLQANPRAAYAIFYLAVRGSGRAWFDDVSLIHDEVSADKFAPVDGATFADNAPFFTWRPHRGARRYTVELSRDPAFGEGTVRSYDAGGIAEFQLLEPLEPGVWYWRVLAKGLEDPQPWRFTQTAPVDRDCLPPRIVSRGARVCAADQPFTVRVKEKEPREISVVFKAGGLEVAALPYGEPPSRRLEGDEVEYRFAPPSGGWPKGLMEGNLVTKDAAGNVATRRFWLLNAPKPANAVVVSADGRYEQDGKRIFPLGIYEVAPKYMQEVRQAGFDVVHTYRWESDQDDVACRAYLDACWAADGLRAFIGFDRGTRSQDGIVQGNFAHIARRVGALADHAGLFCWYLFDEPEIPAQFVSPDLLTALADLVRELDPYHPVVMTTWNETMNEYRRTWDTHWTQAYGDPAGVVRQIAEHRKFLKNASPITLLVNCNDQKQGAARRRGVEPDPAKFSRDYDHLRACAMLGVAEECNGLWWWWFARDCRDYYTAAQNPKAWDDLRKVVREMVELRPLVNAPGAERNGHVGDAKRPVVWWAKETGGRTAVIAVNTSTEPQTVDVPALGDAGKGLVFSRYEVKIFR